MIQTKRDFFKRAVLASFGVMTGIAVIDAAADPLPADKAFAPKPPIFIRQNGSKPIAITRQMDGTYRAFEITPKGNFKLPDDLSKIDLFNNPNIDLASDVSRQITIKGVTLVIEHGVLKNPDDLFSARIGWRESTFGEVKNR